MHLNSLPSVGTLELASHWLYLQVQKKQNHGSLHSLPKMQPPLHHFWFVQATHTRESDYSSIVGSQKSLREGTGVHEVQVNECQPPGGCLRRHIPDHTAQSPVSFLKQGLTLTVAQAGLECLKQLRLQVGGTVPSLPSQIFQSEVLF